MNITEKDIFRFVFYPGELTEAKFKYIKKNLAKYGDIIEKLSAEKKEFDELSDEQLEELSIQILKKLKD